MSNTEDYLDKLLNSMKGEKQEGETDDFLSGLDADAFRQQFDDEGKDDIFVDTLSEEPEALLSETETNAEPMQEDIFGSKAQEPADESEPEASFSDLFSESEPKVQEEEKPVEDDSDLMALLHAEGDFSELGDMFHESEPKAQESADESEPEASFSDLFGGGEPEVQEETVQDTNAGFGLSQETEQTSERKESSGFLKKVSRVLFGEDELEEAVQEPVSAPATEADPLGIFGTDDVSDENFRLLQELEGGGTESESGAQEPAETQEDAAERKKKEKEEKKAKKKAAQAQKRAQAKAAQAEKRAKKARQAKMKKPKEQDLTPPLPKKPVILCFVMVASFLLLVLLGTNLFGYSSGIANAKKQFALGNYEQAYRAVAGMEMKEQDIDTYEKYRLLANVSGEYDAYETFMEAGVFDMALDSLVRAAGRCQKYLPEAELYGCSGELAKLKEQTQAALGTFGMTEEQALSLYAIEERSEYSVQLQQILAQTGYAVN
mgnify:CR=1 FL=1